jgi:hypothetical protein
MKKVNVNELDVFDIEELKKEFYVDIEDDISKDDIVFEIMMGSRGEVEEIKKVNVVDGIFEVNEIDEISEIVLEDVDEGNFDDEEEFEESKEYMLEYVCSEFSKLNNKKVYLEGWFEESCSYYVRFK